MLRLIGALVALAALAAVGASLALADQQFDDPAGDGKGAPDVTRVEVSNDSSDRVTFRVLFAEPGVEAVTTKAWIEIDLDRDADTGNDDGAEIVILWDAQEDAYAFYRWNGKAMARDEPTALRMLVREKELEVSLDWASFGSRRAFDFWVYADTYTADAVTGTDSAPDGSAVWTYTLETKAVKMRAQPPEGSPRFPVAGKPFTVQMFVFRESDGSRVTTGTVQCVLRLGSKLVRATQSYAGRVATCTTTLPASARGKLLTGSIGLATRGGQVARTFRFKVA